MLVIVSDGADDEMEQRHTTVEEVLDSLGATEAPRIDALNKCDLFADNPDRMPGAVRISASTGAHLDELLEVIEQKLNHGLKEVNLLFPFDKISLLNKFRSLGTVLKEEYIAEGVAVRILLEEQSVHYAIREGAKVTDDTGNILQNIEENDTML